MDERRRDSGLSEEVLGLLRARTGFRHDAIQPEVLRRALGNHPRFSPDASETPHPDVIKKLLETMLVSETYFFRHPEHFKFVIEWAHARFLRGRTDLRVWSAGCSTGEEAYSLAACLQSLGPGLQVEVLGSDLSERNLAHARAGRYGAWSRRSVGPLLFPVGSQLPDDPALTVFPALRATTRFLHHNLLDPLPSKEGVFDIVFCRNVLVYLDDDAVKRVCAQLVGRLAPDGILILGNVDAQLPPEGLVRTGPPDVSAFAHPSQATESRTTAAPIPSSPARVAAAPRVSAKRIVAGYHTDPIELHTRALVLVERGRHSEAQRLLSELGMQWPDYLPGLLERALLFGRCGQAARARALMHELLRRLEGKPADASLRGPEELPVSYYRASAEAFLGHDVGREGTR